MKDLNCAAFLKGGAGEENDVNCWSGSFTGNDVNGHAMKIDLVQAGRRVNGTWNFTQSGIKVHATITEADVNGNTLVGRWTQTGVEMSGSFVWTWLPNRRCKDFEGSFGGTRYWEDMRKQ